MKFQAVLAIGIIVLFAGCSKPTAEELSAKAKKYQEEARANATSPKKSLDSLNRLALQNYLELIKTHPRSLQTEEALFMVATIQHNELQEYGMAVESYKGYTRSFPEGKQAAMALFLTGYLYNNELHNLDSARAAYQQFLKRYPNNEMAMSAKFELDNLGKTPEELLPKPVPEGKPSPRIAAKPSKKKK